MYDENGLLTLDPTLMTSTKYTVKVNKRRSGPSFANVSLLKDPANSSQMTLIKPTDLGGSASSAPLGGKYIINCEDPVNPGVIAKTREISWASWGPSIEHILMQDMPFLSSKIVVKDLGVKDQSYWENARRFAIIFEGMDVNMPQCYITSGIDDPMTGSAVSFE